MSCEPWEALAPAGDVVARSTIETSAGLTAVYAKPASRTPRLTCRTDKSWRAAAFSADTVARGIVLAATLVLAALAPLTLWAMPEAVWSMCTSWTEAETRSWVAGSETTHTGLHAPRTIVTRLARCETVGSSEA